VAIILCYFTEFSSFRASYIKVIELRAIRSWAEMLLKQSGLRQYMIYGDILRGY